MVSQASMLVEMVVEGGGRVCHAWGERSELQKRQEQQVCKPRINTGSVRPRLEREGIASEIKRHGRDAQAHPCE